MMQTLLTLFYEFFKTGLFAVGGGLATIPFLNDMALRRDWFTTAELADMIAVGESTPGPIGINCATYAGFNAAGVPGALVASFAIVLPSFIIITAISGFLQKYQQSALVQNAFAGLRPAVTGLIAAAGWSVLVTALFTGQFLGFLDLKGAALFALLLVLTNLPKLKGWHPLVFIGLAAGFGIAFAM